MQREASERLRPTDVYFFATCLVDLFCPEAGIDAITLIESEGITVHFPENQTCCGQPAYTSGFADQARAVALTQMQLFPNDWPVVVPSGSCAGIIRHHYPKLFADDPRSRPKPKPWPNGYSNSPNSCSMCSRCAGRTAASRRQSRCIPPVPRAARWVPTSTPAPCSPSCPASMS